MKDRFDRIRWFQDSRFGLFLHWGLYAIPGRGEWVRSHHRVPLEEYDRYFRMFDPVDYDPAQWAREAKAAGMQYAVLTSKHHDGFCLFDTKTTDYNAMKACGRDLVREYLEAFRAEGLKVGLYYSLLDWYHADYPKYDDMAHPMRGNAEYEGEVIDFERYLDYMHAQVEELMRDYGKLDILWFDFSYEDMQGEKWRGEQLMKMVRGYQPDILVNNRLEGSGSGYGSLMTGNPTASAGDFVAPEQILPPSGIRDEKGNPIPWELCATLNNNWGYTPHDTLYKPVPMLIRKLVECVSKDGNMLLNIGPDARGCFNAPSSEALAGIGAWMEKNAESIYGCGVADFPKPEWGRYTQKGNILYAHVMEAPLGPLPITGVSQEAVESITLLADGSELHQGENFMGKVFADTLFVNFGEEPNYTYPLPDPVDTVIKIVLKEV